MSARLDLNYDSNAHALYIKVIQGPLHIVHSLSFLENDVPCDLTTVSLSLPFPARTDVINSYLDQILQKYLNNGFPFAKITLKAFELIPDTNQVHLIIEMVTGAKLFFGEISFLQQQRCSKRFLEKHLTFKKDDLYSARKVSETCKNLEKTCLFEEVSTELDNPDSCAPHCVPILFRVPETSPRSTGIGISLSTQSGLGGLFDWSHSNLWGENEQAYLSTVLNQSEQEIYMSCLSHIRTKQDLSFLIATSIKRGFHHEALEYSGSLSCSLLLEKRPLQKIGIKWESFYDTFVGTTFLFSAPIEGSYPYFDRKGLSLSFFRVWWNCEPFVSFLSSESYFMKTQGGIAFSLPFPKKNRLGFHIQAHSILGAKKDQVPLALRCFGGSAHILRGYAYRTISPLNTDNFPIGGMSLLAASVEPRVPLSKDLDFVPFLDIGQVYPESLPNWDHSFFYSIGVGFRKKISIGSIRADIGFPMRKRSNLDHPMELYVLLGENF